MLPKPCDTPVYPSAKVSLPRDLLESLGLTKEKTGQKKQFPRDPQATAQIIGPLQTKIGIVEGQRRRISRFSLFSPSSSPSLQLGCSQADTALQRAVTGWKQP
ncbi:hypothetical protein BHE74_00024959 [Ensete ventricosum]|nr:hypothetical protein GW17_00011669 [Ensete ventricosum]RWW67580.1 hypothetical protein BHE74_00024959 [Ensete ventricosum]RZR76138.1 hypothetical protein BHM03_00000762 [Ensete ventricosum]